jgi:hypothetical protein
VSEQEAGGPLQGRWNVSSGAELMEERRKDAEAQRKMAQYRQILGQR